MTPSHHNTRPHETITSTSLFQFTYNPSSLSTCCYITNERSTRRLITSGHNSNFEDSGLLGYFTLYMGMLRWTPGTSRRARHEQPWQLKLWRVLVSWLLRSMEDNASPLRIHLLMCVLSTLNNEQISCKYTVKWPVYKHLSQMANGNRKWLTETEVFPRLITYNFHYKHILNMNCIYIANKRQTTSQVIIKAGEASAH